MHRTTRWFARIMSVLVGIALLSTALLAGPAPIALADGPETTLFRAEFDSAPLGPLAGPLLVEQGSVVAQAGTVTIASGPTGRALTLDSSASQATALMQWSNYPGAIPVNSQGTLTVRITGNFTTSISDTVGASFSLLNGADTCGQGLLRLPRGMERERTTSVDRHAVRCLLHPGIAGQRQHGD